MKPPLPRLLLALARHLTRRRAPTSKARPAGTAHPTNPCDGAAHPALRHLRNLHRPHTERGHHSPYTICFECGLLWPCPTRQTLEQTLTLSDCPHCDPDHRTPWSGTWAAFIPTTRDRDGQPTAIHLMRPDGSHVAERDATWIQEVLEAAADNHHRPLTEMPTDESTALLRDDASRATGMLMALDLHQALDLPFDHSIDHQGHPDHPTWWADLLSRVRTRTRSAPTQSHTPPPAPTPVQGSSLYARTFNAITYAIADHNRFLPLNTREHATRQVLAELANDLLDPDQPPGPDQVSFQMGTSTHTRCLACDQDDARFQLTHYILDEQGQSHPVGRTDVCTNCMHSPFTDTGQENPS